jgi:hypothetical protein
MDNNKNFIKNSRALKFRYPDIFKKIVHLTYDRSRYRKIITEKGLPTLEVRVKDGWILLNSSKDPFQEAKRLVSSSTDGTEEVVAVAGLGMGYQVEELLHKSEHTIIAVLEPSDELFCEIIRTRDISHILSSERVFFFFNPRDVDYSGISPLPFIPRMKLIISRPYNMLFGEIMKEFIQGFHTYLNSIQINTATLKRFDRLWTKNTFKNTPHFFSITGIDSIRGIMKGIPAVVLAAGPSLDDEITLLKVIKERAVLISVDTALKPIMKRGIVPDFVVTVDPQYINSFHLANIEEIANGKALPVLVADPAVYPSILNNYPGQKLITSSVFPPGRIIERFSGGKGIVSSGGSVATTAFDFARFTGAEPIIIMGLDLSYRTGKTHLSGSFIDEYIYSRNTRFLTAQTILSNSIRKGKPTVVEDKTGRRVFTDRRMLLYKSWFEQQLRCGKISVFNATKGGLKIEGMEDISPEELLNLLSKNRRKGFLKKMNSRLRKGFIKELAIKKSGIEGFLGYIKVVIANLFRMERLARKALHIIERSSNLDVKLTIDEMAELEKLDTSLLSFKEENQLLSMVMQSPINEVLSRKANKGDDDWLGNSRKLYSSIEDSLNFLNNLLSTTMKRMENLLQSI